MIHIKRFLVGLSIVGLAGGFLAAFMWACTLGVYAVIALSILLGSPFIYFMGKDILED